MVSWTSFKMFIIFFNVKKIVFHVFRTCNIKIKKELYILKEDIKVSKAI